MKRILAFCADMPASLWFIVVVAVLGFIDAYQQAGWRGIGFATGFLALFVLVFIFAAWQENWNMHHPSATVGAPQKEDVPPVFNCSGYGGCCDNANCSGCGFYQQWEREVLDPWLQEHRQKDSPQT